MTFEFSNRPILKSWLTSLLHFLFIYSFYLFIFFLQFWCKQILTWDHVVSGLNSMTYNFHCPPAPDEGGHPIHFHPRAPGKGKEKKKEKGKKKKKGNERREKGTIVWKRKLYTEKIRKVEEINKNNHMPFLSPPRPGWGGAPGHFYPRAPGPKVTPLVKFLVNGQSTSILKGWYSRYSI